MSPLAGPSACCEKGDLSAPARLSPARTWAWAGWRRLRRGSPRWLRPFRERVQSSRPSWCQLVHLDVTRVVSVVCERGGRSGRSAQFAGALSRLEAVSSRRGTSARRASRQARQASLLGWARDARAGRAGHRRVSLSLRVCSSAGQRELPAKRLRLRPLAAFFPLGHLV